MRGCSARENVKLYSHIFFFLIGIFHLFTVWILSVYTSSFKLGLENTTRQHTGTETDSDTVYYQKLLMGVNAYFLRSYFWIFFHYQRIKSLTWRISIYYAVLIACLQKKAQNRKCFCIVWNTSQNKTMSIMSKLYFRCWFSHSHPVLRSFTD